MRWHILVLMGLLGLFGCDDGADGAVTDAGPGDTGVLTPPCPDPEAAGPHAIERLDLRVDDPQRDGQLELRATAPSEGGPFPLLVLSHGTFAEPYYYDDLAGHLASHGFVVLAPRHHDALGPTLERVAVACDEIPQAEQFPRFGEVLIGLFETDHVQHRVGDVRATMDAAAGLTADGGALAGRIDTAQIGVVGHSFGGFTSTITAGAQIDAQGVAALCPDGPQLADALHGQQGRFITCAVFGGTDIEAFDGSTLADPRVKVLINLAGPVDGIWGAEAAGLGQIQAPALFVYSTTDAAVPYQDVPAAFSSVPTPSGLLTIEGGHHSNFGTNDDEALGVLLEAIPEGCVYGELLAGMGGSDEPALPIAEQHRLTRTAAAAFALQHLAGVARCEDHLTGPYFEGLSDAATYE